MELAYPETLPMSAESLLLSSGWLAARNDYFLILTTRIQNQ